MMDEQELANSLFGASRIEATERHTMSTIQGVAVADSVDGTVKVQINGESIAEEADVTEPNTVVEIPTTPAVKAGDTVTITCEGGVFKTMTVTGNNGSGDYGEQLTDEASKVAKNFIQLTDDNNIIIGNLSDEAAQNDATDTNIIFECTGTVSQNDTTFSKDGHVHEGLFVKSRSITKRYTIKASKDGSIDFECPTVAGKTPLLICECESGNLNVYLYALKLYDNHVFAGLKNTSSKSVTGWFIVKLLYIADGWIEEAE